MTDPEADPTGRPVLLAAAPSTEHVVGWLRTLTLLAGVLAVLTALFTLELVGRL